MIEERADLFVGEFILAFIVDFEVHLIYLCLSFIADAALLAFFNCYDTATTVFGLANLIANVVILLNLLLMTRFTLTGSHQYYLISSDKG